MTFDRDKLVKFLGMLGSDGLGERANAAKMASEHLRAAGLTWEDVIRKPPEKVELSALHRQAATEARERHNRYSVSRRHMAYGWTAMDLLDRVAAMASSTPKNDAFLNSLDPSTGLTELEWTTLAGLARDAGVDMDRPPRRTSL